MDGQYLCYLLSAPLVPSSSPRLPLGLLTLFFLVKERSLHTMARRKKLQTKGASVFTDAFCEFPADPWTCCEPHSAAGEAA